MTGILITLSIITLAAIAACFYFYGFFYAENKLLKALYADADARASALLERLLLKHGQTPLSEPVSTPKPLEQAPTLTLYQQRLKEGAQEDEQEARRFRTIPLSEEEKAELAEEARRRA